MLYSKTTRFLSILVVVALLAGTLVPATVMAQMAAEESPPQGIRFDAPPYAIDGPYAVGVRYFTIPAERETDRELTASVWYPALNPDGETGEMVYEQQFAPGNIPPFSVLGHALLDAEPDPSGGPYPLIVYSHAHWSMAQELPYFTEHLASRGFVVISTDHEDNWSTDFGLTPYETAVRRPQEITRQIDFAEMLGADDGDLPGMIATEKVGVAGWSMGAMTSLEVAGTRKDLVGLRAWCAEDPFHMEIASYACVDILEYETEIAEFAGLDEIPTGLWSSTKDERIAAAVPMSGSTAQFGSEGLSYVDIPVLLFHGGGEAETDPSLLMGHPYESVSSARKAEVVFDQAEHLLFFSSCADSPSIVELGFPTFCTDPVWEMDRAHDLINHFATAFLLAELTGDEEAAAALSADQVNFSGIEYREKGYGAAPDVDPAINPLGQGLRFDAPEFAIHGPYWVGYQSVVIGEETDHPLTAGLWYPALNIDGDAEAVTYDSVLKMELGPLDAPLVVYGHALRDAEVNANDAPYPLVIFSPGFGADASMYTTLIEHYTSHGFVVLAPEHMEQFDPEYSDLWKTSIDRPRDITQVLDYAEQITAPDGDMADVIDMQNVAVVGHSYGGYTALAMAGAQYDLDAFNARCAQLAPDDPDQFLCMPLVPKEADMAERAGFDPMPEGLWPSFGDPRVTAIVPIAGDSYLFDQAGLSKITVPMMAIGGTADTGTPFDWGAQPAFENVSSPRKALVAMQGAEHTIASKCDGSAWIGETPFYYWICFDPVWDKERGLDLIHHFSVAFLLAELKGDEAAAAALASDQVNFTGIEYRETGYGPGMGLDAETTTAVDGIVETAMADNGVPGMAMCIVKDGEVAYSQGFGVAEVGSDHLVTPETVFEMQSVSKSMTAMAIMQLVEQGLVDLDAPVTDYLPDFVMADPRFADITVRMLLSHTSGLPGSPWTFELKTGSSPLEQAVGSLADQELVASPGEQWIYTPKGYTLLGEMIAQLSGDPFEAYMQHNILEPLGMVNSTFNPSEVDREQLAPPHITDADGNTVVLNAPHDPRLAPAKTLHSTCTDMARWASAMLNGGELDGVRILQPSSIDAMWTGESPTPYLGYLGEPYGPILAEYGLGWYVGDIDGHRTTGHAGGVDGYNTQLQIAPDDGFAVIAMSNWNLDPALPASYAAFDVMFQLLQASE